MKQYAFAVTSGDIRVSVIVLALNYTDALTTAKLEAADLIQNAGFGPDTKVSLQAVIEQPAAPAAATP